MVRRITAVLIALVGAVVTLTAQQAPWPPVFSIYDQSVYRFNLGKTAGMEMTDGFWAHLHQGMPDAQTVSLGLVATNARSTGKPLSEITDVQVRWMVKGVAVSPWLDTPFAFTLAIDNPDLPAKDGVFDISVDVQGAGRDKYTFSPLFLHLYRGRDLDPEVPVCSRDMQYDDQGVTQGAGCQYVKYSDAHRVGRPAPPEVQAWHGPTWSEPNLYQEELMPHTNLFDPQQFWWEEPFDGPHAGMKFARAIVPKWDEDHRGLRVNWHHDRFPIVDGPRGIGWTSTYIMGQVDQQGNFCFVETGGALRCMDATGTLVTKVGWHVTPGHEPVWPSKTIQQIRHGQTFEGVFLSGRYADPAGYPDGFRSPLDLALDPLHPNVYYVAGYEDQVIWKADCSAFPATPCQVSVFAGDVNHSTGFTDGVGTLARFSGPASLVFDPVCDCLYVADQNNDAVRKITRAGAVTTLFGTPGQDARQVQRGVTDAAVTAAANGQESRYFIQGLNRTAAGDHYARGAGSSTSLETYLPQAIRVDSQGNIVLLDIGFGGIRRINPSTLQATHLAAVNQRFETNFEGAPNQGITGSTRGFAFLDVDRWGNAGVLDTVYYGAFQSADCDGESEQHMNEAYCAMPIAGAPAHFLFPKSWDPWPDGHGNRETTSPPHYYWLMQVDPRGALILGGGGEHGLTRMRKMKPGDFDFRAFTNNDWYDYERGKEIARYGLGGLEATPIVRHGSEGHTFLGLIDATDYKTATDTEITAAFGMQHYSLADQTLYAKYIRANAWLANGQTTQTDPVTQNEVCHTQTGTPTGWELVANSNPLLERVTRQDTVIEDVPPSGPNPTLCNPGPGPLPIVTVSERLYVAPLQLGFTSEAAASTCSVTLTAAQTPDGTTGWKVQFRDAGGAVFSTQLSKAPWTRTKSLPLALANGPFTATWTKTGAQTQQGVLTVRRECR